MTPCLPTLYSGTLIVPFPMVRSCRVRWATAHRLGTGFHHPATSGHVWRRELHATYDSIVRCAGRWYQCRSFSVVCTTHLPRCIATVRPAFSLPRPLALSARFSSPCSLYEVLADALHGELIQLELLPPLLNMASDPVPNIRFNVAKTLGKLAPRVGAEVITTEIAPCLSHLIATDSDRDVKYFARKALEIATAAR